MLNPSVFITRYEDRKQTMQHIKTQVRLTERLRLEVTSGDHLLYPLLKRGHPKQVAQDHVKSALEDLQRGRLHSLSGQPVPGLHHPHRRKAFPDVQTEPHFVCACCLLTWHWAPLKTEWLSLLFAPSLQVFTYINKIPTPEPPLLHAEQSQQSRPLLRGEVLPDP